MGVLELGDSYHESANNVVSIPGRDLGVLEPSHRCRCTAPDHVSIPGRDLGVLEPTQSFYLQSELTRFNPWKGFGGFGNISNQVYKMGNLKFQSLEGIWGFWNQFEQKQEIHKRLVSIPGRDLGVLERDRDYDRALFWSGFNPWKGFGGFGTAGFVPRNSQFWRFQSLEGIWGFWNDALQSCRDW